MRDKFIFTEKASKFICDYIKENNIQITDESNAVRVKLTSGAQDIILQALDNSEPVPVPSGTPLKVGDTFNSIYFNLNKSSEDIKTYLSGLSYDSQKHIFAKFDMEMSTAGYTPIMSMRNSETDKYSLAAVTYENIIWDEDNGWHTSDSEEIYVDGSTGKLSFSDEYAEIFEANPIDMIDSTEGWNGVLISSTPF